MFAILHALGMFVADLLKSRSLRACLYVPGQSNGYPRPADLAWIAVAKWHCGTSDRHNASRVSGSDADLWRGPSAAYSFRLCGLLQSSAHASDIKERCTFA